MRATVRTVPAAATPRLRDRLMGLSRGPHDGSGGPLAVLHRGSLATYLRVTDGGGGDFALGLLAGTAVGVPNGLRTALDDLDDLDVHDARVEHGDLRLGDHVVRVGRLVDARAPRVAQAAGGDAQAVLGGIGRGDGLTPYGDDVACGWLATRRAAGLPLPVDAVRAAARRTTLLSATLLECALHGEVVPELARWLAAPTAETEAALLQVGASSGRGLLTGARLALGAGAIEAGAAAA